MKDGSFSPSLLPTDFLCSLKTLTFGTTHWIAFYANHISTELEFQALRSSLPLLCDLSNQQWELSRVRASKGPELLVKGRRVERPKN